MKKITFFTKPECALCRSAWFVIQKVCRDLPIETEVVDISAPHNQNWYEQYKHDIPVVHLDGREILRHRVVEKDLRAALAGQENTPGQISDGG